MEKSWKKKRKSRNFTSPTRTSLFYWGVSSSRMFVESKPRCPDRLVV